MIESETLLEKARSYLKKNDIFYTDVALISHLGMRSKKNHVLVFSGFNLLILTQKKVTKKIANKYEKSIFDISSISLDQYKNILILFTKNSNEFKLAFQKEDPQSFVHLIVNHVHRLLTPYEYRKITIDELSMPTNLAPRTSHSILSRLYLQLAAHQIIAQKILMQRVSHHLYSHLNSFIFSKFRKMRRFFKLFFPCLSMAKWVNQIDIWCPKHVFRLMFKQIECFENIVHVKIRGTESKELQDFVVKSKNVNSLSFHDYPVDTFDFISVLIQNNIDSIGFDSALDEIGFKTFIELPSFSNLNYFRVSDFDRLDFSTNLEKFRQLKVLSLTSCKLKVGEVLEELIINQVTTLKKLDLSGNFGNGFQRYYAKNRRMVPNHPARRPKSLISRNRPQLKLQDLQSQNDIEMKVSLPCRLDALFVNEVEWDVDQLIFFMNLCSSSFIFNLSINRILFQDPNKKTTATNESENSSENRRHHHRIHHHNTTMSNNNNDDDQIIEEEEEYSDDYDDEYDDVFAMNDDVINNNKLNTTDIFKNDIDKWNELFNNFPKQMNSIRMLNWNSNKISNEFIKFLLSSPKLNEVSFCECNCSDITFIETLLKNHRIQKVNMKQIRFNERLLYFHTFKTFLANIPQMKYLRQIDLSHNLIDDDCFKCMSESLMNADIEFIALDDSNASSYEVLSKFYHKLEKSREQPLLISFPCLDIQRLEIGKPEIFEIIQCSSNLKKPLSKRTTEFQRFIPEVSFLRLDNNFPQFWPKERNGQEFNRTQTLTSIHHQINNSNPNLNVNLDPNPNTTIKHKNPNNNDYNDDNDDDNNNKNNNNNNDNNTNNNNKTTTNNNINIKNKSINNFNKSSHYAFDISGDEDENDTDSIKIPKSINSRNHVPKIAPIKKQRSVYNVNLSDDKSSDLDIPKSPKNKIQVKPSHNRRNSFNNSSSSNLSLNSRKITYNFNTDTDDINDNNSMRKNSKHRSKSVNDNDNNSNSNSDMSNEINNFNSNNKKINHFNSTKSLTPKPKHRKLSIDKFNDFNNHSFMGFPKNDNDFMNFQPIYKRRWSIHEPKIWKPKVLPASPKIDNTQMLMNYNKEFSIQRLVNKLSKK